MLLMAVCLYAAIPVLSRFEMIGSGRGLALTLGADAPFAISIRDKTSPKADGSLVSIYCSNVIYGLNEYKFTTLPAGCPVQQVLAKENKDGNSVELMIKVLAPLDKAIRSKQKDNRWVVLLTSAPVNDFAWTAQNDADKHSETTTSGALTTKETPASAAVPEKRISVEKTPPPAQHPAVPQVTASSFLEDITILHREQVEKVILKLDSPTDIIVKCTPGKILALFVNTKNGLSHTTFKSEKDWLVKSIELNEVMHGGTKWLGASIIVNEQGGSKPIIQTLSDRLVIYSVRDTKQCLYLWSARNGTTLSYDFISPEQLQVDYSKIEKKVMTDSKNDFGANGTFSVGEPTPAPAKFAKKETGPVSSGGIAASSRPVVPQPARTIRLVVIKDKVNLRSDPSSALNSNRVAQLPLGVIGTQEEKKGQWVRIAFNDMHGWLLASMVLDSGKVPQTMWNKIEAAALEKKKLEEKKLQQEEKVKALAMAREKAKAEALMAEEKGKAEKQAIAEEKARAVQQAKDVQEAREKAAQQAKEAQKAAKLQQKPLAQPPQETGKAPQVAISKNQSPDTVRPPEQPAKVFPKLIEYQVLGRDPFMPLSQDEEGPLPNIENLQLVGILYDAMDRIGLFEDMRNKAKAFALRENDPVKNGYLLRIQTDKVLFLINELGISRTYAMKLYKGKE
jgi:Membrane protein involved in colicin uptake